jgi:hypothetical protein
MAAVTGLTVVKRFTYRTDPTEEFSNTYHFKNPPPGDDASWQVLLDDVVNHEKAVFPPDVFYARAYGYDSDDPNAHNVFVHEYPDTGGPAGTFPITGSFARFAGDQASLCLWTTSRLNTRGKKIYLRKYFHAGFTESAGGDALETTYLVALQNFVGLTGIQAVHGGLRSLGHDETIVGYGVSPYVTTRTLKRRGKRPPPGG